MFVDDRSVDGGWAVLQELARGDEHVRAFRLSRNFGQHAAITAGLAQARGQWAVVMDCDLQEAPEDIPRLWAAARRVRRRPHHAPTVGIPGCGGPAAGASGSSRGLLGATGLQ